MRTDSVAVAESAQQEARAFILERIGAPYAPAKPRVYKNENALAQEAHEAIRPTAIRRLPADMKACLTADQVRLYELIWKRFLASQMAAAIFDVTTVDIDAIGAGVPRYRFRATGSRPQFLGFMRLYREGQDDQAVPDEERQPLPVLVAGEGLDLLHLAPRQHFTEPPSRYTEALLVKAREEPSEEHCSQGHAMVIKNGRTGRFLACSQYPAHQETRALLRPVGVPCPVCGGAVVEKHTRSGTTFFGCVAWPKCNWSSSYPPLS